MNNKNRLVEVQDMVFNQLNELSTAKGTKEQRKEIIEKSSIISNGSQTIIKAINLNLRITEFGMKYHIDNEELKDKLGL